MDDRLPVTLLSGFLGAGKTSVLSNLLHSSEHGLKIAVIVNDMAAVNVDAASVVKVAPKLVSMQNGCICCTLREDLLKQVTELAKELNADASRKWDYLVIESTGISEPLPVAQTFTMEVQGEHEHNHEHKDNEEKKDAEEVVVEEGGMKVLKGNPLLKYARLDTLVTVVDACSFFERLTEIELVKDQPDAEGNEDAKLTLADLLVDQVEFSNVILLNKCDIMIKNKKEREIDAVEQLLKKLNPKAVVVRTNHGKIPHDKILNTYLFDMDVAEQSAGWIAELQKPAHTPETEEYGFGSMVFRAHKPFHPKRLYTILEGLDKKSEKGIAAFEGVMRSKGHIWLANAFAVGFMWHSAGYNFSIEPAQRPFLANAVEEALEVPYLGKSSLDKVLEKIEVVYMEFEDELNECERLRQSGHWTDDFGDRGQELVLIGVDLDKALMKEELENALLTDEEMKKGMDSKLATWKSMEDPFFGGKCAEMYWELEDSDEDSTEEADADAQTGPTNKRQKIEIDTPQDKQ